MVWVLAVMGAVALGVVGWLVHHARCEFLRRRQVLRVRTAIAANGRVSVAELRRRCEADSLARYPTTTNCGRAA
jgi:hypothetical protein